MLLRQQDVAKNENCIFIKSNAKDVLWFSVEISVNQTWAHYENIHFHQIHCISSSTCHDKFAFVYIHWNCCYLEVKMFLAGTKERNVVNYFLPIISSAGYIIQLPKKSDRLHKISLKLINNVFQMTVGIIAVPHPETITLCVHEIWQCHSHELKTFWNINVFLSFYLLCSPLFPVCNPVLPYGFS